MTTNGRSPSGWFGWLADWSVGEPWFRGLCVRGFGPIMLTTGEGPGWLFCRSLSVTRLAVGELCEL